MSKTNHDEQEFREAISASKSIAETCRKLGIRVSGGSYEKIKHKIGEYQIDISHFTGRGWKKDNFLDNPTAPLAIKNKIIRERGHQCEKCSLKEWLGIPITLELEHVDGNNSNHDYSNLKLFCPNCHSQTWTWRRQKSSFLPNLNRQCPSCLGSKTSKSQVCEECTKSSRRKKSISPETPVGTPIPQRVNFCKCGESILRRSDQCETCYCASQEKISWPNTEELVRMIKESNYSQVSRTLGVSDNAIRKRLRIRGLDPKNL